MSKSCHWGYKYFLISLEFSIVFEAVDAQLVFISIIHLSLISVELSGTMVK